VYEKSGFSFENPTQVLRVAQDDNQPEAGTVIMSFWGAERRRIWLVLKDLKTRSFALLRTTTNPRPVPWLCHSEERSDEESGLDPEGFKTLEPGPSLRSGRQSQIFRIRSGRQSKVLRVAQDDNQPEAGTVIMSFWGAERRRIWTWPWRL